MSHFSVEQAVLLLKKGGVCAVVSETVYGLAAHAFLDRAVSLIFETKKRPAHNPLIVHYACLENLKKDVQWTPFAQKLAMHFWPGPLTLVLERIKSSQLSPFVSGALTSVAVRMPAHPIFQRLLKACDFPLVAPSANRSGHLTSTSAEHVRRSLPGVAVLEGACRFGVESTVVDVRDQPTLLRLGSISRCALENVLGMPITPYAQGTIRSPGQLLAHYAPLKPMRLNAVSFEPDEGILAFGPHAPCGQHVFNLSEKGCVMEAAHNLFHGLHVLDVSDCARIAVMPLPKIGMGETIHDRLYRGALAQRA